MLALVHLDFIQLKNIFVNLVVQIVLIVEIVQLTVRSVTKELFCINMSVFMSVGLDIILMSILLLVKFVMLLVLIVQDQLPISVVLVLLPKYFTRDNVLHHVLLELL